MSTPLLRAVVRGGSWAPAAPLLAPGLREPGLREAGLQGAGLMGAAQPELARPVSSPGLLVGNLGACGAPRLYCLISDDSPSVTGGGGNDPLANRYVEAQAAFRALARACTCGRCLGAVLHFDLVGGSGPVPVRDRRPSPMSRRRRLNARLESALQTPRNRLGSSELGPSVAEALRLVDGYPDHEAVLIVASDFQLFDADPAGVIGRLDRFAAERGSVHAVVLGRPVPGGVLASPIRTHLVRPGSAPGALARAVARGLAEYRSGAAILDDPDPIDSAGAASAMPGRAA